jgi:hypothetical protein
MAIRRKIIIASDELSISKKSDFKEAAIDLGIEVAVRRLGSTPDQLVVRHAQNIADFGTALDQWNTAALAVQGTAYSVFQAIAAPALANNKVAVFYGVGIGTPGQVVSLLNFRQGAGGGTTYAQFDLEQLQMEMRPVGFFSEPIVYEPSEVLNVTVVARIATGLLAGIILGCYIIEPAGPSISK